MNEYYSNHVKNKTSTYLKIMTFILIKMLLAYHYFGVEHSNQSSQFPIKRILLCKCMEYIL